MPFESLLNTEVFASARYLQNTNEAQASITVITAEEIKGYGYETLDELLMAQKGLYVSKDRNYTYLGSRGFSRPSDFNNRIVLLLNGTRLVENIYGQGFVGSTLSLNMDQVERVEIIRGPGSALYGSGAMMGIINIVTKTGESIDGVHLNAGYGSYDKKLASGMYGTSMKGGLDLSLSFMGGSTSGQDLYYEELDRPDNNNGLSNGKDWERQYGLNLELSGKYMSLSAYHANRSKGIPTGAWDMLLTGDNRSRDVRTFVGLEYNRDLGAKQSLRSRAYYNDYVYSGKYQMAGWDEFDRNVGRWIGFETEHLWKWGQQNTIITGLEYNYNFRADYTYWIDEDRIFAENFPYGLFSFYLQDEYRVTDKLSFWSGIRLDKHHGCKPFLSPRLAMVAKPFPSSVLKLMYGHAFRAANVYESSVEMLDYLKINPHIVPERINAMELAWEQHIGSKTTASLALYHYKMHDLIVQVLDPVDELVHFVNSDPVFSYGSELELRMATYRNSRGYLNLSLQKSVNAVTRQEISNSPNFMVKAGWSQPVFSFLALSPEVVYESSRLTVYDTRTSPFLLANINIQTGTFLKHFDAGIKVRNLFNVDYSYPGGYDLTQDAIAQDGINFLIQLNAKF